MKTKILSASTPGTAEAAAQILREGGLVAIPTETVYGLAANGLDEKAVAEIFAVKGRPQDNPLILHISGAEQIELFCHHIPQKAYDLAERFWPGPLTIILPARDFIPKRTTGGLSTVGIRCPDCDVTREIIRLAGVPIAAPSANISGKPSTTTAQHVLHDHDGKIDAIVDGGPCRVGVESTIVKPEADGTLLLLRPGSITKEALEERLGLSVRVAPSVLGQLKEGEKVLSPGMKYRHYAPNAPLVLLDGTNDDVQAFLLKQSKAERCLVLAYTEEIPHLSGVNTIDIGARDDLSTQAKRLFSALRAANELELDKIYAHLPTQNGLGLALYNRMIRAAAHTVKQIQ